MARGMPGQIQYKEAAWLRDFGLCWAQSLSPLAQQRGEQPGEGQRVQHEKAELQTQSCQGRQPATRRTPTQQHQLTAWS